MKLYDFELSADCYKLRLMLALLGVRYDIAAIDIFPGDENHSDWFLSLNPAGTLPVLDDNGVLHVDAHTALTHLAAAYGAPHWSAADAPLATQLAEWLDFATRLKATVSAARDALGFGFALDIDAAQAEGHRLLRRLDRHLWFAEQRGEHWLLPGAEPTIADIAVFPDTALSEEANVSRQDYPAIRRWLDRVKRLPGFVVMSGVFPAGPARQHA